MPCDVLLTYPKERVVIFEDMIPHGLASIAADTLNSIPQIDYVIRGEGEFSFSKFCTLIDSGESPESVNIDGLSYRLNGEIIHNRAVRIDDLDSLPLPARHLFDLPYVPGRPAVQERRAHSE